jgi:GAF domain-containing protein/HAMP domain-containing protein
MNQHPVSSAPNPLSPSGGIPLRVRLILGNALILLIATTVLGYYIFNRLQASSAAQSEQLYQSILQQTRTNLEATTTIEANQLNDFFRALRQNVVALQKTTENLLAKEDIFGNGMLWDARQNLARLANGSWDNPNNETSAIYVPGKNELSDPLVFELNTLKELDHFAPVLLQENPDTIAIYFGSVNGTTIYYPNIDLAAVLPPDFDVTQRPWFMAAAPEANPNRGAVWSVPYLDAAQNGLVVTVSAPVYDQTNHFRGVIAMDIQLNRITTLISGIQVEKNGYALLLDSTNRIIAMPPAAYADFGLTPEQAPLGTTLEPTQLTHVSPEFRRILAEMNAGKNGIATLSLRDANRFIAYHPIPEVNYSLAVIAPANELLANAIAARETLQSESRQIVGQSIVLISIILLIALLATFGFSNSLIAPLSELTHSAQKIAAGEFVEVRTKARDELGTLANAFNTMTAALRDLIQSLEQRVAERTAQAENARLQSEKRAQRLEVISQVSRAISQESNLDDLLPFITQLVSERFNFYHVGIFLLDDEKQYAVLRAANSEGGKRMLARGHRLAVGRTGIVGYVAQSGQPRIALDVGVDAVFFNNPDLPQTRSEMALPLSVGNQIIGVLDVQSSEPAAFTEEDANTFSILADQIAIAIDNARLIEQTQKALNESQAFYRQYIQQGWHAFAHQRRKLGYYKSLAGGKFVDTITLSETTRQALEKGEIVVEKPASPEDSETIIVPIRLRDQILGVLNVKGTESGRTWHQEEIKIIQAISERLALALENARLFEETSRRAERERLVSEITSRIRSTNDPSEMIKTAIHELKNALGASRVEVIPQKVSSGENREEE